MCGIAGYICNDPRRPAPAELVQRMARSLSHRGPDYCGAHADGQAALGHARLSIIDLRPEANQPMLSHGGDVAVVFNGEIYNFKALAAELRREGVQLRTRSDTEVLLEAYCRWGVDFVGRLRGMFAFAIWDRPRRRLMLGRDRVGQKPLFYHPGRQGISFASEARTLLLDPDLEPAVDLQGMHLYLSLGYVPSSCSTFRDVRKVQPGSYVLWEDGALQPERRYWKLRFDAPTRRPSRAERREQVAELRRRLADAVEARMISDVPLGAFLSGGVDSSAVVALMAQSSSQPVKTFSIGFDDADFTELSFARMVADRYHTDHHEEIVRANAAELLPTLVEQYGEPFADPSAIPTYCLARMTRRHVTVALSGDGGDETFCGYTRYAYERAARLYQWLPRRVFEPAARALLRLPNTHGGKVGELLADVRHRAWRIQQPDAARYVCEFGNVFPHFLQGLYGPEMRAAGLAEAEALFEQLRDESTANNAVDELLDIDTNTYLPDDIFVKVDIAAMAHSLEVRSPLIDHHVMEYAATLHPSVKLLGFRGKRIFRDAVADLLPREILTRRKRGFGIPHARWLRGDLRSLARDTLTSTRALGRGYFDRAALQTLLDEHDTGQLDHGLRIWNLLWLELWHRRFIDAPAQASAERPALATGVQR